jgi:hypothetical protein
MADYILEPLDTDNEVIFQNFVDFVQTFFPEWHPSEGQLDIIIARYFSMQSAATADMASRVLRAIYRYFGSSLAGINPLAGSAATATVSFTIEDPIDPPVDRLLPFGTLVGITDRNGDIQIFSTLDDLSIPAGVTTGQIDVQCTEVGVDANKVTGSVELIELVEWISSGVVIGVSSGGSDPEDDGVYIQRLTENLALMAPRPILAEDFPVFAQNIPGVWRSAVIDNFRPGAHEQQTLTSNYTAGTFKIGMSELTATPSAPIPATATAAQVRDALIGMPYIELTDFDCSGGPLPGTPIVVTFKGKLGYRNLNAMTIDLSSLTGGTTFNVTQTVNGAAYATDKENSVAISSIDVDGDPLPTDVKDDLIAYLESTRAQNFLITFVDPAYHSVDITYTARALKFQDAESVRTLVDQNLRFYLGQDKWGVYPYESNSRSWNLQPVVRYLELTTLVENTPGIDYVESLTFSLDGGPSNTSDKTFSGAFSLTTPGNINGTINLPT